MNPVVTKASSPFFSVPRNSALLPFIRICNGVDLKSPGDFSTFWMNSENASFWSGARGLMSCHTKKKVKSSMAQTRMVL